MLNNVVYCLYTAYIVYLSFLTKSKERHIVYAYNAVLYNSNIGSN